MADRKHFRAGSRFGRSRIVAAAASGAVLLAACSPAAQQATGTRPVTQVDAELGSLLRVADMTRKSGEYETATALYRRANQMSPDDPRPLVELASMLGDIGSHAEAALIWQDALRVASDDPAVLGGYGLTLARLGQPDLAQPYLTKAVAAGPTSPTYNALGVVHDQLGNPGEAQAAYRAGLKLTPNDISLANNLGLSLALTGHLDESLKLLEQIVVRPDATARHRQNLALAYGLAGQDDLSAQFGSIDFDPAEAQKNVMRYASIVSLPDHATRVSAVGALRGAQADRLASSASVQSAALVNSRNRPVNSSQQAEAPVPPAERVSKPVTPMLNATSLVEADRAPAKSGKVTAKTAVGSVPDRLTAAVPAVKPAAPELVASSRKTKNVATSDTPAATALMKPAPDLKSVATKAPTSLSGAMAVDEALPVAAEPATERQVYRAKFTPKPAMATVAKVTPATVQTASVPPSVSKTARAESVIETDPDMPEKSAHANDETETVLPPEVPVRKASVDPARMASPDATPGGKNANATPTVETAAIVGTKAPGADKKAVAVVVPPEPIIAYSPELAGIEVPSIDERLRVAASAYNAEEYELAASIWHPLAEAGVERAQFHLGALYYEGRGVERDLAKAYMMLRKAEIAGFGDARVVLALVETKLSAAARQTVDSQLAVASQ